MVAVRDGQLLRSTQDPSIYLVLRGRRRHVPDPETFEYLRLDRNAVLETEPSEVASVPLGPALPSLRGRLSVPASPPTSTVSSDSAETLKGLHSNTSIILLFLGITLTLVVLAFILPGLLTPRSGFTAVEREQAVAALRGNILQVVTVIGVLLGYALTLQSLQVSRATYHSTLDNQLSERYAKSLELTEMSKGFEVRLGGLLALGRIARTSRQDRQNIVNFFSVLLRHPADPAPTGSTTPARQAPEVAAMVTALGDLMTASLASRLSLQGLALRDHSKLPLRFGDADLRGCSLANVEARSSNLTDASMPDATLSNVDLRFSSLSRLMAREARVEDCDMSWSNLEGAVFIGANLARTSLVGARLRGSHFIGTDLRGANLRSIDLRGVNLDDADLMDARADSKTAFPAGVDPIARGVVFGD
jgi:uncharacterized protein YjbI with pentapeptide repeats